MQCYLARLGISQSLYISKSCDMFIQSECSQIISSKFRRVRLHRQAYASKPPPSQSPPYIILLCLFTGGSLAHYGILYITCMFTFTMFCLIWMYRRFSIAHYGILYITCMFTFTKMFCFYMNVHILYTIVFVLHSLF